MKKQNMISSKRGRGVTNNLEALNTLKLSTIKGFLGI
jgi:hypothetical protein